MTVLPVRGAVHVPPVTPAVTTSAAQRPAAPARLPGGPDLRVSISDGQAAVRMGEQLSYAVRVQNSGATAAPHLKITETLPPGLRLISAGRAGHAAGGTIGWRASIPARGAKVFRVRAKVVRITAHRLRLAAVACAATAHSSAPAVCAADLDRLAARGTGARAGQGTTRAAAPLLGYAAAALLAALVAGVLLAVVIVRRARVTRRLHLPR